MQKNALFNHGIVRYEVALGVVGAVISKCADQIGDALRKTPPDMETVTHLQAKQRELEVLRTAIDPFDVEKSTPSLRSTARSSAASRSCEEPAMPRELTDNELHRLYRAVEVADISRTAHQETPIAIMTGGQPGSGKTGLTGIALQELALRGGAVVIDADRMREYNPDYRRLMASDPEHAADLTHPTAAQWANQLRDRAIFERRNLVVDGTMRDPNDVARVAKQLKDAGYIVDARVMAVPGDVSFAHARLRYESLDNEAQAGRVVNQRQHDAAYAGVPQSLERLEANKLVDRITIYDTSAARSTRTCSRADSGRHRRKPRKHWWPCAIAAVPATSEPITSMRSRRSKRKRPCAIRSRPAGEPAGPCRLDRRSTPPARNWRSSSSLLPMPGPRRSTTGRASPRSRATPSSTVRTSNWLTCARVSRPRRPKVSAIASIRLQSRACRNSSIAERSPRATSVRRTRGG